MPLSESSIIVKGIQALVRPSPVAMRKEEFLSQFSSFECLPHQLFESGRILFLLSDYG